MCALDQSAAIALGLKPPRVRAWHESLTLYYSARASPIAENILALNGSGSGLINSVLVMSDVAPAYAADKDALIAVSILNRNNLSHAELLNAVQAELEGWYGPVASAWGLVASLDLPESLLAYEGGDLPFEANATAEPGVFLAGDLLTIPSQEGAATSGRTAAEAVRDFLRG